MYNRGYPTQSPRFSPQRGNENYQRSPYNNNNNNNNASPYCGAYHQGNPNNGQYRTPSPGGPGTHNSSFSSPFQIPHSPRESPFMNPSLRLQFQHPGNSYYRAPSPRGKGAFGQPTRSPRQFSPRQNLSPYHTSPRGNSSYRNTSTPNFRGNSRGRFNYKRDGGNCDIKMYYNTRMIEDPWKSITPVPFKHAPATT